MSLLRGCISLRAVANRPVAYVILSLWDSAVWLRIQGARCAGQSVYASIVLFACGLEVVRQAISAALRFPTRWPQPSGMMFGDAVSSAILMG